MSNSGVKRRLSKEGTAIPTFNCVFRLAGSEAECQTKSVFIPPDLLDTCADMYSEHLILYTQRHYEQYLRAHVPIRNTFLQDPPGDYLLREFKVRASTVTGHIGESIIIPTLSSCLGRDMTTIPFQRLRARIRCPDYRIVLSGGDVASLWPSSCTSNVEATTELRMPLEVKATTKVSHSVPKEAVLQLYQYWQECRRDDPTTIGWGIVARMCKLDTIYYYLFMPRPGLSAVELLSNSADALWNERGVWFC